MTRIDFYVLSHGSEQQRAAFACRLTEKALHLGHGIYLHTASPAATARLDEMLWTFRDGSFLPHLPAAEVAETDPNGCTPVLLGHGEAPDDHADLLINLADEVPLFFSRFDRVAEIVSGENADRDLARDRYRFYRDRGYSLKTHKI